MIDSPVGSFVAVDATGGTSHDRIWEVGNVVDRMVNVAGSIGAGPSAAAAANGALVAEHTDQGLHPEAPTAAPADYWQQRYAAADRMWSGRVNQTLADVAADLEPGRALDLGCGEGADAIWLAQRGWRVVGIDIAPAAIERAHTAAAAAGVGERVEFLVADLSDLDHTERFDLVTASFLHSPVHLPRETILRRAAELVADGGHLLVTSHAAAPPGADSSAHEHTFPTVADELDALHLDDAWETVLAQIRTRHSLGPDGQTATLDDVVVLARRSDFAEEPKAS